MTLPNTRNVLQFIDIDRKLREKLVNELNIITADFSEGYKTAFIHQMRSAIADSFDALLT